MSSSSTSLSRVWVGLALLLCAAPLVALLCQAGGHASGELLLHLSRTVLPMQLGYSLGVAALATLLGLALALGGLGCALWEFPGRALLEKLLFLPLLWPCWFLAELFRERGLVEGSHGLVLVLAIGSAPLLHLFGTAALRRLPRRYLELLELEGRDRPASLGRTLLPLAAPALGAAAGLCFLYAWADSASARAMAVPTLTVGLFDQWFGREDDAGGALHALAVTALSLLPALLLHARIARGRWQDSARLPPDPRRLRLRGAGRAIPWLLSIPQLALGLGYPAVVIGQWVAERIARVDLSALAGDLLRTLLVAVAGTLVAALLALPLLHARATASGRGLAGLGSRLAFSLFALPAAVLGIAFLFIFAEGEGGGAIAQLNATPLPLALAVGLRFAAVYLVAGEAALRRQAAAHCALLRSLGRTGALSFLRLLRPYLAGPALAAAGFVLLESMKELTLTLLLQPFGWSTVSTRIFQYAQTQQLRDCAIWVLCLALAGLYPLLTLARLSAASGERRS